MGLLLGCPNDDVSSSEWSGNQCRRRGRRDGRHLAVWINRSLLPSKGRFDGDARNALYSDLIQTLEALAGSTHTFYRIHITMQFALSSKINVSKTFAAKVRVSGCQGGNSRECSAGDFRRSREIRPAPPSAIG